MTNQQNGYAPSEDSDQPGNPPSLIRVFAVRMKKAWILSRDMVFYYNGVVLANSVSEDIVLLISPSKILAGIFIYQYSK